MTPVCISKFVRVLTAGIIPYAVTGQVQSVNRMALNWKAQVCLPAIEGIFHMGTLDMFWSCPSIISQGN